MRWDLVYPTIQMDLLLLLMLNLDNFENPFKSYDHPGGQIIDEAVFHRPTFLQLAYFNHFLTWWEEFAQINLSLIIYSLV